MLYLEVWRCTWGSGAVSGGSCAVPGGLALYRGVWCYIGWSDDVPGGLELYRGLVLYRVGLVLCSGV